MATDASGSPGAPDTPDTPESSVHIWIDADACPRPARAFVLKAGARLRVPITLVANNGVGMPRSALVRTVVVGKGLDAADHYILAQSTAGDLVVTADIPLAAALIRKGVAAVDPRGRVFTADNVSEALATRNLMADLREQGFVQGGPPPRGANDQAQFANAFDRELTRLLRLKR